MAFSVAFFAVNSQLYTAGLEQGTVWKGLEDIEAENVTIKLDGSLRILNVQPEMSELERRFHNRLGFCRHLSQRLQDVPCPNRHNGDTGGTRFRGIRRGTTNPESRDGFKFWKKLSPTSFPPEIKGINSLSSWTHTFPGLKGESTRVGTRLFR